jgi:hypothetical protein
MTAAWKQSVVKKLADNELAHIDPMDQAALARCLGVHKTAIGKMLKPEAQASKLVQPICDVLGLLLPLQERGEISEIDAALAEVLDGLSPEGKADALVMLRIHAKNAGNSAS